MRIVYILSACMWICFSCGENFMEVSPNDRVVDEAFWETEADIEMALTGLYNQWEEHWNILWWDLMTDNGYSQFSWDDVRVMGNGQANASNVGRNYFGYEQIRKCNNFLEKIGQFSMDEATKNQYMAEARFLRAYDYFRKVQFYGDVPLVTEVIQNPEEAKLGRTPKAEVVDFILRELQEIATLLPRQNMLESGGRITSGAALALKARLELYEGDFEGAMSDSKAVWDMAKEGIYELFPDYSGLFLVDNETNNKESVLEIQYVRDTYENNIWQHILPAKEGGWSSISAVQSIVDTYEMADGRTIEEAGADYNPDEPFKDRDPRLDMTILYPGKRYNGRYFNSLDASSPDYHQNAAAPRSGYNVLKYSKVVPSEMLSNGDANVMVIRLAEVLLIYAEAAIESGRIDNDVYEAINHVRLRSGMPEVDRTVYNSQEKLRELVRRERRVELAFEGLRYWDIKRWDIGEQALHGPLYGSRLGSVNEQNGKVTWQNERIKLEDRIFYPERRYLFPIPQAELDANPNMDQNEGY